MDEKRFYNDLFTNTYALFPEYCVVIPAGDGHFYTI